MEDGGGIEEAQVKVILLTLVHDALSEGEADLILKETPLETMGHEEMETGLQRSLLCAQNSAICIIPV